ncbi:MAG: SRPBCC domain-containing protein, partial [Planctomycetota bacterium]
LLRFTWENANHCPGTTVEVTFDPKGMEKSVVRLTHSRLADAKAREEMKEGWTWAMDNLKRYLEKGEVQTFEAWREQRATDS